MKSLGSQFRMVEIAPGQAGAPDIEFAGNANGHGLQMLVEHIDLRVGNRTANGHARESTGCQTGVIPRRVVGRFRRTVEIDQATVW